MSKVTWHLHELPLHDDPPAKRNGGLFGVVAYPQVPPPKVLGGDDAPFKMLASQMEFDSCVLAL